MSSTRRQDDAQSVIAPYGSWESPITAAHIAAHSHPVTGACYVGDEIWYAERIPEENGRTTIFRRTGSGEVVSLLPGRWNVHSRVHEYGGGSWAVLPTPEGPALYFVELSDQRIYRLLPGNRTPEALTSATGARIRYGDLTVTGGRLWAVQEEHTPADRVAGAHGEPHDPAAGVRRRLVVLADEGFRPVVEGTHFLAWPRVSPDGARLAWIGWDHPAMPWDATRLFVAKLADDGDGPRLDGAPVALLGSGIESVLQPEWATSRKLLLSSDRSGYWNLYALEIDLVESRSDAAAPDLEEVLRLQRDIGGPLWSLGARWYGLANRGGALLAETRFGTSQLRWLNRSGDAEVIETPFDTIVLADIHADGTRALVLGAGRHMATGLYAVDLRTGEPEAVRLSLDDLPAHDYLPEPYEETFVEEETGREVHAIVSLPRNPRFAARSEELPPFVAFVHGGPTAQATIGISVHHAFFTSRGIGVIDVNYGGSTGYGREYRERLRGQWGVVDVEDTVAAVKGLVAQGLADPSRLLISGGSAGGWTVLSALTSTDVFAAGASYYGVAELSAFVNETHDFESRYVEGLVGPLPMARELYERRAPLNNLHRLRTPVIVFQGLLDPIVPPSQAERLRAGFEAADLPYAYVSYEGESHGFQQAASIMDSLQSELSFYGQVLGFETPGIPRVRLRGRGR